MQKNKLLKIVNLILAFLFVSIAISGIFQDYIPYELFSKFHPLTGYALVITVAVHIFLNFNWIKANYLKRKK
ncbi:MAG TPA: hypothetical protein DIC19_01665 [Erysipelotrichaceae bacterium]|nr:hypothetical protein [Erysipelotrichaceae bacterium]